MLKDEKMAVLKENLGIIKPENILIWSDPAEKTYFRIVLVIKYYDVYEELGNFSECLKYIDSTKYKYSDDSIYYLKRKAKYPDDPRKEIVEELRNFATELNVTYNF